MTRRAINQGETQKQQHRRNPNVSPRAIQTHHQITFRQQL
jgi:hypothetical protein